MLAGLGEVLHSVPETSLCFAFYLYLFVYWGARAHMWKDNVMSHFSLLPRELNPGYEVWQQAHDQLSHLPSPIVGTLKCFLSDCVNVVSAISNCSGSLGFADLGAVDTWQARVAFLGRMGTATSTYYSQKRSTPERLVDSKCHVK